MMKIYGIRNCDTCRKALKWLDAAGRDYDWHDLRADGVSDARLRRWLDSVEPGKLVNRRSTTWRGLSDEERGLAEAPQTAVSLLSSHPTLIKRPVIETGDRVLVGFNEFVKQSL